MKKTCLFIDDGEDLDSITERLTSKGRSIGIEINCMVFNPMEEEFLNPGDFSMNVSAVETKLVQYYLKRKIDLIACDYQLGDKVVYGHEILRKIRHYNKVCSFILYSGALEDVVSNLVKDNKGGIKRTDKILDNIEGLIQSRINRFIRKGNEEIIIDETIDILRHSSMEQILINNLQDFDHLYFNGVFPEFNGKKINEIINFLKNHSNEGNRYSNEIIEQAVSLTVAIDNVR